MQAPKEIRNWVNRLRRKFGKSNGVVSTGLFDFPDKERKWKTSKKNYKRNKLKRVIE